MKKLRLLTIALMVAALAAAIIGAAFTLTPASGETKAERTAEDCIFDAQRYSKQDSMDMAKALYAEALELDGSNYEALMGMAQTLNRLQDYDGALEIYNKMAELYPDDAQAQSRRLWLMLDLGMNDQVKKEIPAIAARIDDDGIKQIADNLSPEAPEFDVPDGEFDDYFLLYLSGEDGEIYYTTDGSDPTLASKLYTDDGIVISYPETVIRAAVRNSLGFWSECTEHRYVITKQVLPISWRNGAGLGEMISDAFGVDYETQVYNYDLAQIRELYIIGSQYYCSDPEMEYLSNGYRWPGQSGLMMDERYIFNKRGTAVLDYLPYLKTLGMCYQSVVDMEKISSLKYLENLSLMCDHIDDISALSQLTYLKQLNLGWNEVTDITPLAGLDQMEKLGLWGNQIEDISCVRMMSSLKSLDVSNNPVSDITALAGLENLEEAILSGTDVRDISPITGSVITILWNGEG